MSDLGRAFIKADSNAPLVLTRKYGHGIKTINTSDCTHFDVVNFKTDVESKDLNLIKVGKDNDEHPYMILCKEFGVAGGVDSNISIIFCDGGWMLVTLYEGGIPILVDGNLMCANKNISGYPEISKNNIVWLNAERILGNLKVLTDKAELHQDFEFFLTVSGINNGFANVKFKHLKDSTIDISGGYYEVYLENREKRKKAREVKKMTNSMLDKLFNYKEEVDTSYLDHNSDEDDAYYSDEDDGEL